MMNYVMIFIVGVIIGIILMAIITAANNIQWGCRDENDVFTVYSEDVVSRKGLIDYLNLDDLDDTDSVKVKYIRQFINKKEE